MKNFTIEEIREKGTIIFEVYRGSFAYGTYIEGKSDKDKAGVYIMPLDYILGDYALNEKPSNMQVSDERNDEVYYELGRFLSLLEKNNPTMLELLNVAPEMVIYKHPIMDEILKHRDKFITKKCKDTFGGYVKQQLQKAKGQNKKMNMKKKDMPRKSPLDFIYVQDDKQGTQYITRWLENRGLKQEYCGLVKLNNMRDCYGLYYDYAQHLLREKPEYDTEEFYNIVYDVTLAPGKHWYKEFLEKNECLKYKGIIRNEEKSTSISIASVPENERPKIVVYYNEEGYQMHCREYKEYKEWEANRNEARYQSVIEANTDEEGEMIDCYLEEETEFLTLKGWKKFDEVLDDDTLITFNKENKRTYSKIIDKFDKPYTGTIHTFENSYNRFSVTPNHNLWLSDGNRSLKNGFSTKYIDTDKWYFKTVDNYLTDKKNYKFFLRNVVNTKGDYPVYSDDYLRILGLFISEGSYNGTDTKIQRISISQLENGKIDFILNQIKNYSYSEISHERKGRIEKYYNFSDKNLIKRLSHDLPEMNCKDRGLPEDIIYLSKRQFDILLEALVAGDGHKHSKGHIIYYTASKKLAESLHYLLTVNGYNTQLYGGCNGYHSDKGYKPHDMWQVFISKDHTMAAMVNKNLKPDGIRKIGWTSKLVTDKRIVCFTTEQGTLITKNNNKISYQGNSKNMMHCARLSTMAKEIALGMGIIVYRPDAQYLLDIRNGKYSLKTLYERYNAATGENDELYRQSNLPDDVDHDFVVELLIKIRKEFYGLHLRTWLENAI